MPKNIIILRVLWEVWKWQNFKTFLKSTHHKNEQAMRHVLVTSCSKKWVIFEHKTEISCKGKAPCFFLRIHLQKRCSLRRQRSKAFSKEKNYFSINGEKSADKSTQSRNLLIRPNQIDNNGLRKDLWPGVNMHHWSAPQEGAL